MALRTVARRGYVLDLAHDADRPQGRPRPPKVGLHGFAMAGLDARDAAMPTLIRDAILGGLARFRSLEVIRGEAPETCDHVVDGLLWSDSGGAMLRLTLLEPALERVAWSATFACTGTGPGPDVGTARRIIGALSAAIGTETGMQSHRRARGSLTALGACLARGHDLRRSQRRSGLWPGLVIPRLCGIRAAR